MHTGFDGQGDSLEPSSLSLSHSTAERLELEQRYHKLLQEHMSCGVTIAKLEAQVAEYLAFMERFRSALQREEHG